MNKDILYKAWNCLKSALLKSQIILLVQTVSFPADGNLNRYLTSLVKLLTPYILGEIKRNCPKYWKLLILILVLAVNVTAHAAGCEGAAGDICTI